MVRWLFMCRLSLIVPFRCRNCVLTMTFTTTVTFSDDDLFRVSHFGEIGYVWQYVQLLKHLEYALWIITANLCYLSVCVMNVTEDDRITCASLLTSCFRFAICQYTSFFLRIQFRSLCALNAEATFFHYTS